MELIVVVLVLLALDAAAIRWGVNSRDDFDSPVWGARSEWPVYRGDR